MDKSRSDRDATPCKDGTVSEPDPWQAPSEDLSGQRMGAYRLERLLGRGGMGAVYLASRDDGEFEKHVAVKVVRPSLASPEHLRRFRKERQVLAGLDHPNIARLLDGGTTRQGLPYFVMEYVPGETLENALRGGPFRVDNALRLARTLAEVLASVHSAGLAVRDLTPSNIMVTEGGDVKVLDFGIAKNTGNVGDESTTALTEPGTVVGNPAYMSPEQAVGDPILPASDVFSFGVVVFRVLSGNLPFAGEARVAYVRNLIDREPRNLPASIPRPLRLLVERCLVKEPSARIASGVELVRELAEVEHELRDGAQGSQPFNRIWWAIAAGAALVAALALPLIASLVNRAASSGDAFPASPLPVATTAWTEMEARISPDGRTISYLSDEGGRAAIWTRKEGETANPLLTPGDEVVSHTWSPDGDEIAYLTHAAGAWFLRTMSVAGTTRATVHPLQLTDASLVRWLNGGVYVLAHGTMWRFDLSTGTLNEIANQRGSLSLRTADLSADGRRIVFGAVQDGLSSLWIANSDGSRARQLTQDRIAPRFPHFVGQGSDQIVYVSDQGDQTDLWQMDVGGGRRRLTFSRDREDRPVISDDGHLLLYGLMTENANLGVLDPDVGDPLVQILTDDSLADFFPSTADEVAAFQRARVADSIGGTQHATVLVSTSGFRHAPIQIGEGVAPQVSPDGRFISYLEWAPRGRATLRIHDLRSGATSAVSKRFRRAAYNIFPMGWISTNGSWAPVSASFYFISEGDDGADQIRVVSVGGPQSLESDSDLLVSHGIGSFLGDLFVSPDGSVLAYVVESRTESRWEVRWLDLASRTNRIAMQSPLDRVISVVGWLGDRIVLFRWSESSIGSSEVLLLDEHGRQEFAGRLDSPEPGSLSLDNSKGRLYFVRAKDGLPGLFAYLIDKAEERTIMVSPSPNQTFSGIRALADGSIILSIQVRNRDIWSVDLRP